MFGFCLSLVREMSRTFCTQTSCDCLLVIAGQGLELGLDLWSYSPAFTDSAKEHLSMAYMLLNRPEFNSILDLHAQHRHSCMSKPFPHAKSSGGGASGATAAADGSVGVAASSGSDFKRRFFKKH
jgi:hypothetical protein